MSKEELAGKLYACYCKELCYYKVKRKWNKCNKYVGMCAISALIVNDYFGGQICKMHVNGVSHYFNLIENDIIDLTSKQFENDISYADYIIVKRKDILTKETLRRYNLLKSRLQSLNNFDTLEITEIDNNNMYLHYTSVSNLNNIFKRGLEPNIGMNAAVIEKTKKVFFSIGDKGALVIMDSWLKWLVAKPISNFIYLIGAYLLKVKFFPKFIHNIIITGNFRSKRKHKWAYEKLHEILSDSVYLNLALEENIDFSFDDVDEIKALSNYPKSYISKLYAHDSDAEDATVEYWNMHTFSNKVIKPSKIFMLKQNNNYCADNIVKYLIEENMLYVKKNCKLLFEYYNYFYK